jgi:hypothetical protein
VGRDGRHSDPATFTLGRLRALAVVAVFAFALGLRTTDASAAPLLWARDGWQAEAGGSLAAWHVFRLHSDTPSERPSSTLDLHFEADHRRWLRLVVAGRMGFDGKIGNPDRGNPWLDLAEVYQDKDLYLGLDEAYLEASFRSVELRVGKQKVSWGRLDELQPTDNLNPEDLTEVLFRPELERKIGVPGARLTWYAGAWTTDAVWNPFYTALRLPHDQDRWFPPLLQFPDHATTPLGTVPVEAHYPDVEAPPHTLASSDAAIRVGRQVGNAAITASLFHGWDKTATFAAGGTATVVPTGDPAQPAAPSIDIDIRPTLHRVTVVGADLAVPVLLLALRAEAAWIHGRFFPLRIRDQIATDPGLVTTVRDTVGRVARSGIAETVALPLPASELERDALQYGIGFDFTVPGALARRVPGGEALAGTFLLLQLIETVILDHDAPFLADQVEHVLGLTLRQSFRDERLTTELKLAYNPNHGDYYVWPQITYRIAENWHALFEARVLGGDPNQTIGQYRHHDGIKIGLRRFF